MNIRENQYLPIKITAQQRANLETLWTYLGMISHVNMADFITTHDDVMQPIFYFENRDNPHTVCGTVCCLAGNGPFAGIEPLAGEDWGEYAARAFGADGDSDSIDLASYRTWLWLFDSQWFYIDNTVEGGRTRIRIALDYGIPVDYEDQCNGVAELSYSEEE